MTGDMSGSQPNRPLVTSARGDSALVSVIIPYFDQFSELQRCLAAMVHQTWPSIQVIVVDNTPRQDTRLEGLCSGMPFRCEVVWEAKKGSYAARNRGIECAHGDLLAFTDSDCIPEPNWIENGVIASHDRGSIGGKIVVTTNDPLSPRLTEIFEQKFAFRQQEYVRNGFAATANLIVPSFVMHEVGAFNGGLQSGGDMEWGLRARAAGFPVSYAHTVVVSHPGRTTLRELWRKHRRIRSGHIQLKRAGTLQPPLVGGHPGPEVPAVYPSVVAPIKNVARRTYSGELRDAGDVLRCFIGAAVVVAAWGFESLSQRLSRRW
jgi:GT2 family glycosyltransferase